MNITNIIIFTLNIFSFCYAIPYANWEYKQKNIAGTIIIYLIVLATLTLTIIHFIF